MLKLIAGKKGSGKTKQLISMVNDAVDTSSGKVVCIDKGGKLTYDVNHGARLFKTEDYNISGYDALYGFLAGIAASDFDVKEIYVDSVAKIVGDDIDRISNFFDKVDAISTKEELTITMTLSRDAQELPESITKYVTLNLK